jgi:hypothetical protein
MLCPISRGLGQRAHGKRDHAHGQHHADHAHAKKSQRLDVRQTVARADKARAPQQDEQHGRCRDRKFRQAHS